MKEPQTLKCFVNILKLLLFHVGEKWHVAENEKTKLDAPIK